MVVARARGHDSQRNVAARQRLQHEADHTVAADDHHCVCAALEGLIHQSARVAGIGPDDFDDVDPPLLQPRDGFLSGMRRVSVP
ncbi:hypothetical protein MNVI_45280 [Mycobacterium noviomagense]|uniref:Uncharacterized protein n=1 Tax=Mycobacterium noviomagense TaxID=459858 RepID=A0A7I7PL22_9MYCO|nr:hypothetical protein MNVI_45280 [Mycobacterium noviomagense]